MTRTFHLVRIPDVSEWLRLGWIARPSLEGTRHGEWSALCEWLCACPMARPVTTPTPYHVQLSPELVRALEAFAAAQGVKPETIIAESVRAYLGAE